MCAPLARFKCRLLCVVRCGFLKGNTQTAEMSEAKNCVLKAGDKFLFNGKRDRLEPSLDAPQLKPLELKSLWGEFPHNQVK